MECAVQFNFFQKIIIQIRPQWQVSECEKQNNKQIHLKLIRYRHGNFPDKRRDRRTLILLEKFPRIAGERIFFIIFSCSSKRPPSLLLRRMFARAFLSWNGTKIQGTVGGQVVASRGAFQSDSPREVWRGQVTETPDVFYLIFLFQVFQRLEHKKENFCVMRNSSAIGRDGRTLFGPKNISLGDETPWSWESLDPLKSSSSNLPPAERSDRLQTFWNTCQGPIYCHGRSTFHRKMGNFQVKSILCKWWSRASPPGGTWAEMFKSNKYPGMWQIQ